jgi:hypothetical protein
MRRPDLPAIREPLDVLGRDGRLPRPLTIDFADEGCAEEGTKVPDVAGPLRPGNGPVGLVKCVFGQLTASRTPLGQPAYLGIRDYSREIIMEAHSSPSGKTAGQRWVT